MKISIGTNIKEGPWGGGNLFVKNISSFLQKNGHKVIYDLTDPDIIDIIHIINIIDIMNFHDFP